MRAQIMWVAAALWCGVADARGHLVRPIDARNGLELVATSSLAQDERGFLWIGTHGGLQRYDGYEIRPWARAAIHIEVIRIRPANDGSLYCVDSLRRLWRVVGNSAQRVDGATDPVEDVQPASDGILWAVINDALHKRDRNNHWSAVPGLDHIRLLRLGGDGALWAASRSTVWRIEGDRVVRMIEDRQIDAPYRQIVDVLPLSSHAFEFLRREGTVVSVDAGTATELYNGNMGAMALARRGTVTWVAYGPKLVALREGQPPEVISHGVLESAGPMLVDRDGSLWVGSFQGLFQFPEPETSFLMAADGLPEGPRFLMATDEGVWMSSWSGLGRIDPHTLAATNEHQLVRVNACLDRQGRLWMADEQSFLVRISGAFERRIVAPNKASEAEGCAPALDGGVWLIAGDGLSRVRAGDDQPIAVQPPTEPGRITAMIEDHTGKLWIARDLDVCSTDARQPITPASWTCHPIAGAEMIYRLIETERGHIWAATGPVGVQRFDEHAQAWEPIPGTERLASRYILGLNSSPRGGTWLVGHGVLHRVFDRPDLADGWQIVEAPTAWNGLFATEGEDVLDAPDGTLWITQSIGVIHMPVAVRDQHPPAPQVELIGIKSDGRDYSNATALDLPHRRNRLELDFAALTYRDPAHLQYRVRLSPDDPWSEPTTQHSFRFVDLPPGQYHAEVSATLDGTHWSVSPVAFEFSVDRPWYLQAWAIALFIAIVLAAIYVLYRLRLAFHLRLERQRARIAMDLHDEMGSALGSIGILAGLATGDLAETERRKMTEKIADTAEDLGESLGDIVWSLREGSATLDALVAHVRERASRLFPDGKQLAFELPANVPPVRLSLPVCGNVQRIALEALHNAARHAAAKQVVLGLAPDGKRWRLWIEDNGIGIAPDAPRGRRGLGLTSMRRRAREIDASITIDAPKGGGTRVTIVFEPGAEDIRLVPPSHDRANDAPS